MTRKEAIEEAISHLYTYSSTMGSGQTTQAQHEESKRVAIDTMRKYLQIEQIINYRYTKSVAETLDEIIKVVEDGNEK